MSQPERTPTSPPEHVPTSPPERGAFLTPEQARHRRRVSLELLWACTVFLLPWSIYLMITLPRSYDAKHYDLAWFGFDVLELFALGATAYFGLRRRQAIIGAALASATLLVCDAWFDIALDLGTPGIWTALAAALLVELPLAGFLIHRVSQLMRLTLLRLYAETDEQGRPMKLLHVPMLVDPVLLPERDGQHAAGTGQGELSTRPENTTRREKENPGT